MKGWVGLVGWPTAVVISVVCQMVSVLRQNGNGHQFTLRFVKYAQSSRCTAMKDSSVSYAAASLTIKWPGPTGPPTASTAEGVVMSPHRPHRCARRHWTIDDWLPDRNLVEWRRRWFVGWKCGVRKHGWTGKMWGRVEKCVTGNCGTNKMEEGKCQFPSWHFHFLTVCPVPMGFLLLHFVWPNSTDSLIDCRIFLLSGTEVSSDWRPRRLGYCCTMCLFSVGHCWGSC